MTQRILRTISAWGCAFALAMLPGVALRAEAKESPVPYIQQMVQYYLHYQEDAQGEIQILLDYIKELDPEQGKLWQAIMDNWSRCNTALKTGEAVLPDGLPKDDSLCIVVLGYALRADGTMRRELIDRLEAALDSAEKYPNAYIAVTGGGTAAESDITEAEAMARWLSERGISRDRIILEKKSRSTTYNAVNTYQILRKSYPSVTSIAIVTSDYHVSWGAMMFQTVSDCNAAQGNRAIDVIAAGANPTDNDMDTLYAQAQGIAAITGIPLKENGTPAM